MTSEDQKLTLGPLLRRGIPFSFFQFSDSLGAWLLQVLKVDLTILDCCFTTDSLWWPQFLLPFFIFNISFALTLIFFF